jgi:hypothetical protein
MPTTFGGACQRINNVMFFILIFGGCYTDERLGNFCYTDAGRRANVRTSDISNGKRSSPLSWHWKLKNMRVALSLEAISDRNSSVGQDSEHVMLRAYIT